MYAWYMRAVVRNMSARAGKGVCKPAAGAGGAGGAGLMCAVWQTVVPAACGEVGLPRAAAPSALPVATATWVASRRGRRHLSPSVRPAESPSGCTQHTNPTRTHTTHNLDASFDVDFCVVQRDLKLYQDQVRRKNRVLVQIPVLRYSRTPQETNNPFATHFACPRVCESTACCRAGARLRCAGHGRALRRRSVCGSCAFGAIQRSTRARDGTPTP